jgi:mono/diheme cytochrome c family protein
MRYPLSRFRPRGAFSLGLVICVLASLPPAASAQDQALIAAGQNLYDSNCAPCHGENLVNPGSSFDLKELRTDERKRFDKSVLDGKGQMPPWRGVLGDAELGQLWAYIQANAN